MLANSLKKKKRLIGNHDKEDKTATNKNVCEVDQRTNRKSEQSCGQ